MPIKTCEAMYAGPAEMIEKPDVEYEAEPQEGLTTR